MDIYDTIEECKNAVPGMTYYNHAEYKSHYSVLESWGDIVTSIINTYMPPTMSTATATATVTATAYKTHLADIKPKLYKQTKEAVRNSLYYMYYRYGMAYYARIREGKLAMFCYLWNPDYENYLSDHLVIDPKYEKKYKGVDKKKWRINGAMIRVYEKKYKGYAMDFYYSETKYLLTKVCESRTIADCDFIIFGKDTLAIKTDLSEPSEEVAGSIIAALPDQFKFSEYCPIFSFNWNVRYGDVPLPTPDDVLRIFGVFVASQCLQLYGKLVTVPWSEKASTAVFRGSFTGGSARVDINPRLHIASLNNKWKYNAQYNEKNKIDGVRFLDAGLSSKGGYTRGRKEIEDKYIRFVDNNYWHHLLVEPLTHEQQSHYKYILYIEGNASAYRGAYLFSFGAVVLWVKSSKYHLWFEPCLENGINCIFIENNLSNLATKIKWLKTHDDKAKKIAEAGAKLYATMLSKDAILDYTEFAINTVCATN